MADVATGIETVFSSPFASSPVTDSSGASSAPDETAKSLNGPFGESMRGW